MPLWLVNPLDSLACSVNNFFFPDDLVAKKKAILSELSAGGALEVVQNISPKVCQTTNI